MKRVAVILAPGTNCHQETVWALEIVKTKPEIVIAETLTDPSSLNRYSGLFWPGGFAMGDHFGAGRASALQAGEALRIMKESGRPMIGICNGFQVFVQAGLFGTDTNTGALVQNDCGHFVSRWCDILVSRQNSWTSAFTRAILRLPVAHGEGKWLKPDNPAPNLVEAFHYAKDGQPTMAEGFNPNGSPQGVAGIVIDNVMGMMPHPERAIDIQTGSESGLLILKAFANLL